MSDDDWYTIIGAVMVVGFLFMLVAPWVARLT